MLTREIIVQNWPDQTRYDLPVRPIGALRWIGLLPMAFAVFFAWMPGRQMLHSIVRLLSGSGSGPDWFFVVFLSIFVLAALLPFGLGLFVLIGRARLVVRPDRIIATELAGPFRWSRIIRFNQIERLEFGPGAQQATQNVPGIFRNITGIVAIMKSGKKSPIAIGYPAEWLQPLLGELTSAMALRGLVVPVAEAALASNLMPVKTELLREKPAGSNIVLADSGWSVELRVPSRGLWRESHGLLGVGVFWCLVIGIISVALLLSGNRSGNWIGGIGVLGVLWLVGVALLLGGIHLGTRRWTLRADRTQLQIEFSSKLRANTWQWPAGDLDDILVGDSGTRVNERMIEQLQVLAKVGRKKTGLLSGRSHAELAWVATMLRQALGMIESEAEPPRKGTGSSRANFD